MADSSHNAHVLIFPYPAPGHMMPLLDLTRNLATRGLKITILVTPKNLPLLDPLLHSHSLNTIETLVFPFPADPTLPPGAENVKDVPPFAIPAIMRGLRKLYDNIVEWFETNPSPPSFIISDMFLWWTQGLACQLGIPRYMFSPSGVMAMSIIYSLRCHPPEEENDDLNRLICLCDVPNSPFFPIWQLRFLYSANYVEGNPISEFLRDGVVANMESHGFVFNSFSDLERVYLDRVIRDANHDRVWVVGPLLSVNDDDNTNSILEKNIIAWLDEFDDDSVVYVCFGTQAVLSNAQIEAIALGLEKSGVKFIWCVKKVPIGYEDRVAEKGLILKGWAPQKKILSNRAVGAFLTHCGWNSVLEGIFGGVFMMTWPVEGEQFLNASLLVDELKVGKRVSEGAKTVPDSDELARVVSEVVGEEKESIKPMRERVMKLRDMAMDAVREGGSSYSDFDGFVAHLLQHNKEN